MSFRNWTAISTGAIALVGMVAWSATAASTIEDDSRKMSDLSADTPIDIRPEALRSEPSLIAPAAAAAGISSDTISIPGVPDRLLGKALASLDQHRGSLAQTGRIGIVDYAAPSSKPRFYIIDLTNRTAEVLRVTHGSGSDPNHDGYLDRFSDIEGSNATSRGAYRTAEVYSGKYGRAERLDGLDDSNRTARERAIVIHNAWYAEPDIALKQKKLGRSQGCFAFSAQDLPQVMAALPPGSLIYADKV